VRAIVRSAQRLPPEIRGNPNLRIFEADLWSLSDEDLRLFLQGCSAVLSCLGHTISLQGIWGPPHDLVTRVTARLCREIEALQPAHPVKLVLMSSVSVNHPLGCDKNRKLLERVCLWIIRGLVPPAKDNQGAATFLHDKLGVSNPFVQWTVVRPDSLLEGPVSDYALHEFLVDGLFTPGRSNRANVAHFMCELVTHSSTWEAWKGKLPVVVNTGVSRG
jgi:hypothetical protein